MARDGASVSEVGVLHPASWAGAEVGAAHLGDLRRVARLATLLSDLAVRPGDGLAAAGATPAATKAADRFFTNDAIAAAEIVAAHVNATVARAAGEATLLALQDTTALAFSAHPALTGAGPLAHPTQTGLWVHSVLAVTTDGVPLGLLHQHVWTRDPATTGQRHTRRQRPTAAKESQRWLDAQSATQIVVPPGTRVITVADREADIFDLFAQARAADGDLLNRAAHNRRVTAETRYLWETARAVPAGAVVPVAVGRRAERPPREALLTLRWTPVTLEPPRHRPQRASLPLVPVTAILADEPVPPPGETPICWLWLTTRPVTAGEAALACVRWHACRWLVERYHYVLKSGCQIEALQLRERDRLERALAVDAIVAWRLLWLTHRARADPDRPCTVALTTTEWQVLARTRHPAARVPAQPPLGQAVRGIARLGGWRDRAGDGEPGVKVLWRGLRRLDDLTLGWRLAQAGPPSAPFPLVGNG